MITVQELYEKLNGPFYFCTVDGYAPRVRPFGFLMVFEDKLYFGCGTHKKAYDELLKNPNVEVCVFKNGSFLRVRGKAVFDDRPEVQKAMYASAPFLKDTYNEETGHYHICFYLEGMSAMEFRGADAIRLI